MKANFAEVLQLIFPYDRSDREATQLARWKAVVGEKGHADVGREVEIRGVRQMAVEVHCAPPGQKLFGVSIESVSRHYLIPRSMSSQARDCVKTRDPSNSTKRPSHSSRELCICRSSSVSVAPFTTVARPVCGQRCPIEECSSPGKPVGQRSGTEDQNGKATERAELQNAAVCVSLSVWFSVVPMPCQFSESSLRRQAV